MRKAQRNNHKMRLQVKRKGSLTWVDVGRENAELCACLYKLLNSYLH